jgi:glycosyltransferase involved in cell wall biosynthesis
LTVSAKHLWEHLPAPLRGRLRELRAWRNIGRWWSIWRAGTVNYDCPRVCYGYDHIPQPGQPASGGIVKLQRMQDLFPNEPRRFNILYMVSSGLPDDWRQLLWLARARKARLVWNQNGVGYPAWHGPGWEGVNRPMATLLHAAHHVFYQSRFCKLSADRFLGQREHAYEILYNAVDTAVFTPATVPAERELILLAAGTLDARDQMVGSLRTLQVLRQRGLKTKLIIAGRCRWSANPRGDLAETRLLAHQLGLDDAVEMLNGYPQSAAPAIYRRAHVLLHAQYNDASPGVVIEALACGLPIVYSASGGVPELVGDDAGIGIPAPLDWERAHPPSSEALAEAVLRIVECRARYAAAARQRALDHFDLRPWLQRHRDVFESLMG